jgi:nitrogen fixation negative regulator NifL
MNDSTPIQRTTTEQLSDCGRVSTGENLPACLFVQTVEQSPVAISITDARANILYVNPAFTQVSGYAQEEAVGRNESMLSDKRTPQDVYEGLWATLQRKEVWRGHLINRHKAGRPYLADLLIAPVLDGEGKTTHYVGLHRDVTELHGLEQTVRNQKVLIESVIDSLPVAAVLLDEEGRVVLDNHAYKSLVSDLNVKEPVHLFLRRLEAELGEEWLRLCDAKQPFRDREVCFERGGGRPARWYSCAGTWFVNGDDSVDGFFHSRRQTYLLLVLSDISRLKRQQEEIRLNAIKSLTAEEEKTGSLREALSAAIHQMQGPMNMLGAVKAMLERRGDPANTGLLDLLGQVLAQGEDSVATLQACLPQGDSQAFVPVNLNRILRDTLEVETDRLLAAGIEVDWQPSPVLPAVAGVESRLRSLFKQLLDNAIESISRSGSRQRELHVGTAAEGEVVRAWVEDSGPGIAPELRLKVFEPFFTGGRRAGMGLALAQDVVNQHGGMIRVAPDCQHGCRMEVHFHALGESHA